MVHTTPPPYSTPSCGEDIRAHTAHSPRELNISASLSHTHTALLTPALRTLRPVCMDLARRWVCELPWLFVFEEVDREPTFTTDHLYCPLHPHVSAHLLSDGEWSSNYMHIYCIFAYTIICTESAGGALTLLYSTAYINAMLIKYNASKQLLCTEVTRCYTKWVLD